jgi:hypothetical protein
VLDSVKRKFFSANTLLAQGEKPRSQSRVESASRKSNAADAADGGGGGELNIAKPENNRRKPQASPQPSPKGRRELRRLPLCSSLPLRIRTSFLGECYRNVCNREHKF